MRIPKESAFAEIIIKKSRFLAYALPVNSLDEIKSLILLKRKEHPDSRHVVHAAVVGEMGSEFSLSDDGEPKGTSGRPALEVLKGSKITNVIVLIVRYFGGTKLGTGGLVKAYGNAVKAVLEQLKTEPLIEKIEFQLSLSYHDHPPVMQLFKNNEVEILEEDFHEGVKIKACCPREKLKTIGPKIRDLTRGKSYLSS